ncbi:MAG: peptidoglycan editing factor PgeF [Pseudomonadota bacterium]
MDLVIKNGLPLLQFSHLNDFTELVHAVTTRQGGVSEGPFESLNLGFNTGDLPPQVLRNRRKVFWALGWEEAPVAIPTQVHGNQVVLVNHTFRSKQPPDPGVPLAPLRGVDGLITREEGILLLIKIADCYPLFLYDPENHAIGLLHAGWRGTAAGIVSCGIKKMMESFGTKPENIRAGIGPGIGACCYQVGKEVWEAFKRRNGFDNSIWKTGERGSLYLDLRKALYLELIGCTVKKEYIGITSECTACNKELFFSYRRDNGKTGRMAALIGIKG